MLKYFPILSFCLLLLFAAAASKSPAQTPGSLDPTFSGDGIAVSGFPTFGGAAYPFGGIALQPDNKVVIAGEVQRDLPNGSHFEAFGILRLKVDGTLDESFGTGGEFTTDIGDSRLGTAIAVQPDGKILFAGIKGYVGFESVLIRLNSDGTFDTTFNNTGVVRSRFGGIEEGITEIMFQPDGKIVTGGWALINVGGRAYRHFLFTRRHADGSLDSSFNETGRLAVSFFEADAFGEGAFLQPDGKIVAVGYTNDYYLAATRINPNGTLDTSFGIDGKTVIRQLGTLLISSAALQKDNKIVLVGRNQYSDNSDFLLVRLTGSGTLDATFGVNGLVRTDFGSTAEWARDVVIQANDKIIAAGYTANNPTQNDFDFALARYNPNGSLDASFGTNGKVTTNLAGNSRDQAFSIKLQRDGKIVVGGMGNWVAFGVTRYFGDPSKPAAFDFDGDRKADVSILRPNTASAEWYWLNSGSGNQSSGLQFGISSDKPAPADFDGDGKTDVSVFRNGDWYRFNSSNNQFVGVHFGQSGDAPVPSDFDGDGRADLAVFRQGVWYILNSSNDSFRAEQFGISTDKPITGADFDGDGRSDLAVYRDGVWYGMRSRDGFFGAQFGVASDKPVVGDYDGDGKTDLAVYRPSDGTWYLQRSSLGFTAAQFGISTDKPSPADFDGDDKTDLAVYRDGDWYLQQSTAGFKALHFGAASDRPLPNAFVP